jgi:hypothetical protein
MCKLLVMSGALVLLAGTVLAQAPSPVPRTILVQGMAERELDPERLDVLLTYRFSDNVKESERTQDQEEALHRVLGRASIAEDKLTLEELTASGYGGKVGNSTIALIKTYRLQLDNPRQLNTLVPQLVQTGADNLRFVNLRSSREAATKAELTTLATANARQKAELAVKGAGGQLGGVLSMVEVLPTNAFSAQLLENYYKSYAYRGQPRENAAPEISTPTLRKIKLVVFYDVVFEVKP